MDRCVAAVVRVKAWPKLTLQSGNCACHIHLNAPRFLWEVFGDSIETIIVEGCLISVNEGFDIRVHGSAGELPVLKRLHIILWKALESFVLNDCTKWGVFHASFWNCEILLELINYVG